MIAEGMVLIATLMPVT